MLGAGMIRVHTMRLTAGLVLGIGASAASAHPTVLDSPQRARDTYE
jgi:hypothetical protein